MKYLIKHLVEILAGLAFIAVIVGLVHHYLNTIDGRWFDWTSMRHHEPLIAICFTGGVALLVGKWLGRRYGKG